MCLSMVKTRIPISASTTAWYPDPVPTSRTRSPGFAPSAWVMNATVYGWEIVCEHPIGRAESSYERLRNGVSTNS